MFRCLRACCSALTYAICFLLMKDFPPYTWTEVGACVKRGSPLSGGAGKLQLQMQWNNVGLPAAHSPIILWMGGRHSWPASYRREPRKASGPKTPASAHVGSGFEEQLRWEKGPAHPHQLGLPDSIRPTPGHRFGISRSPCPEESVAASALGFLAPVLGLLLPLAPFRSQPFHAALPPSGQATPYPSGKVQQACTLPVTPPKSCWIGHLVLTFDGSHRQVCRRSIQCTQ